MKLPRPIGAAAMAAFLAACGTVATRIKADRKAYDASPPEVREKISAGEVAPGFTAEQVVMALGNPQRVYAHRMPALEQEIWVYGRDEAPGAGLTPLYGGGDIVVNNAYFDETMRVVLEKGVVVGVFKRLR